MKPRTGFVPSITAAPPAPPPLHHCAGQRKGRSPACGLQAATVSGTPPRQRLRHWLCLSCYRRPASADFWPWRAFVRAAHRLRRQLRSRLRRLPQPRLARCARLHPGLPGVNRKRLNITAHYPKPLRLPQQNCSRLGPLRALRVRVMVCYVLRPRPSQERYSALRVGSFSAARIVTYVQPWGRASAPAGALAGRLRRAVSW